MPEATIELKPVKIMYICDECGKGQMVEKEELLSLRFRKLLRILHICTTCEYEQIFDVVYPRVEYWPK